MLARPARAAARPLADDPFPGWVLPVGLTVGKGRLAAEPAADEACRFLG